MASPVNPPRGMRDFLPAEKAKRERVLGMIRQSYRAHGFDEIETPVMEDSERLHSGLGGDNEKLAFGVLKRGLTRDDLAAADDALELADLGLRFDLTVPLARFYASHRGELPAVFRAIQIAPVWRAERPQKGRYRQFVQCDIDIIGDSSLTAEVELILATHAALVALGITGFTIRINDRRILDGLMGAIGFSEESHESVLITLDKLDKIGVAGVIAELAERGHSAKSIAGLEKFLSLPSFPKLDSNDERWADIPGISPTLAVELAAIAEAVAAGGGGQLQFDPFLVRGMGYYTGAIFEISHPELGYSLGGGGRYDEMIGRFASTSVPAVGFSLGFERIIDLVGDVDMVAETSVALLYDDGGIYPNPLLAQIKAELIAQGLRVRLEKSVRNSRALFEQLVAEGFTSYATVKQGTRSAAELDFIPLGTRE